MFQLKSVLLIFFAVIFSFNSYLVFAQSPDWKAVFAEWSRDNPNLAKQWEQAKKNAEKKEKNLKDFSDKAFQQSFDSVFGKDVYKPSNALEVMKVLEAASAGDLRVAGETTSNLLIAKYVPVLGQYITVMRTVSSGIKAAEQAWIKGLYDTKAHERFRDIFSEQSTGRDPYIPSYMITYLRNNKQLGGEITKIYDEMRRREAKMFDKWRTDTFEIERLTLAPWASQWRSARGKVPTEREMFNYFLYNKVKNSRRVYMERFTYEYMEPLIRRAAYQHKEKIAQTMNMALANIQQQINVDGNNVQCTVFAKSFRQSMDSMNAKKYEIIEFYRQAKATQDRLFDQMLVEDNAARALRRKPIEEEEARLKVDHARVMELAEKTDALASELQRMKQGINRAKAALPSASDVEAHNMGLESINSQISSYNNFRDARYLPAKSISDEAGNTYNDAMEAFKEKQEEFYASPSIKYGNQALVRNFGRIRKAMKYFETPNTTCIHFEKVAIQDNMQGLIGVDPSPAITMCRAWEGHRQAATKARDESRAAECKPGL